MRVAGVVKNIKRLECSRQEQSGTNLVAGFAIMISDDFSTVIYNMLLLYCIAREKANFRGEWYCSK